MSTFLEHILSTSFHGSLVILAVLAIRLFLPRMPKKFVCYLWLLAGLRLLMPVEIQSGLSLQPDLTPVLLELGWKYPAPEWAADLPYFYFAVATGFLIYTICAYRSVKRRVQEAVKIPGGWECDRIQTAFVLGFLRPKIYIPMNLPAYVSGHILAHERTHLEKGDHWIKMVGFLALALHWFNPLVWVAYSCLCRDIELACDERVVQFMEEDERRAYASALLCCSTNRAHFAACPVAFGEISVKGRVFAVMGYRRPGFAQSALSLAAVAFVAVCLVTSPAVEKNSLLWARNLRLEDVAYMEVTSTKADALDAYQQLEGAEMARMVTLINSASGRSFDSHGFVPKGEETIVLHMADGSIHTVANMNDKYLIIDQDVYTARSAWLKTWELGGKADPNAPVRTASDSPYVRLRWAQDLRAQDIAKVEYLCAAEGKEFERFTSHGLAAWAERISAIDGDLAKTAKVAGAEERIYLDTTYVFMEDGSVYTLRRIAGVGQNYIAIDESIFAVTDEVFNSWPASGAEPCPEDYDPDIQTPAETIPLDQRCRVENVAPAEPIKSRPLRFATYQWLTGLDASQVQRIEFISRTDWETPYRIYTGQELSELLELFHANTCHAYQSHVEISWGNYSTLEFHILLTDGTWHKVSTVQTTTLVIDGAAFAVTSDWVMGLPDTGTDPWPEDYDQIIASREYYMEADEQSIYSTAEFDKERRQLDYTYDTTLDMGALYRTYPLDNWSAEVWAHSANATSTMLTVVENGGNRSGQLTFHSRYWLEQWQEDATAPGVGGYVKLVPQSSPQMEEQTLSSRDKREWFVSWAESYGPLNRGYYRIALSVSESKNGSEGTFYAKFQVE